MDRAPSRPAPPRRVLFPARVAQRRRWTRTLDRRRELGLAERLHAGRGAWRCQRLHQHGSRYAVLDFAPRGAGHPDHRESAEVRQLRSFCRPVVTRLRHARRELVRGAGAQARDALGIARIPKRPAPGRSPRQRRDAFCSTARARRTRAPAETEKACEPRSRGRLARRWRRARRARRRARDRSANSKATVAPMERPTTAARETPSASSTAARSPARSAAS